MKSKLKKSLSLLLALVMVLSCMSMSAFASETAGELKYVAQVGNTKYTDIQEAIAAAMTSTDSSVNHTVTFLDDVEVDTWYQNVFATGYSFLAGHDGEKEYISYHYREGFGDDPGVTAKWSGELTIIGDGHTLKINDVYAVNGRYIFNGFQKLNISNLTIESPHKNGISICMYSGVIDGVTFNIKGCAAITTSGETDPNNNRIEIKNCTFNEYNNYAISTENGLPSSTIISNNTFNTGRAVHVRGGMEFLNNVVNCSEGINVLTDSNTKNAKVKDNYFAADTTRSIKINSASNATITGNVILSKIALDPNVTADLSGNYWTGGKAPKNLPDGVTCNSYYTVASNLPTDTSVGANFTLSSPVNVGGETFAGMTDEQILANETVQTATNDTVVVLDTSNNAEADTNTAYAAEKTTVANSNPVVTKYKVKVAETTNTVNTTETVAYVSSVDTAKVIDKAKTSASNAISVGGTNTIELFVKADNKSTATDTITYEVDPYAIVNSDTSNPVKLSNSDLNEGASFTFSVPVNGIADGKSVRVIHRWDADAEHNYKAGSVDMGLKVVTNSKITLELGSFSYLDITEEYVPTVENINDEWASNAWVYGTNLNMLSAINLQVTLFIPRSWGNNWSAEVVYTDEDGEVVSNRPATVVNKHERGDDGDERLWIVAQEVYPAEMDYNMQVVVKHNGSKVTLYRAANVNPTASPETYTFYSLENGEVNTSVNKYLDALASNYYSKIATEWYATWYDFTVKMKAYGAAAKLAKAATTTPPEG